jgi:flavin reductase (DIM6/NTAB) family NADH-FMN oxidoreductase RutF
MPDDAIMITDPMARDAGRALRDALGRYATGVTVITMRGPDGPLGMTANSFTSVSLDPALVLWCPAKRSSRHDSFVAATHFAIHVLAADQLDLCLRFARSGGNFDGVATDVTPEGQPALPGAMARFDCSRHALHDGGDHTIVVGRVLRATTRAEGEPLLFWGGRYGDFMHHA